jgi:hypothetical protein
MVMRSSSPVRARSSADRHAALSISLSVSPSSPTWAATQVQWAVHERVTMSVKL